MGDSWLDAIADTGLVNPGIIEAAAITEPVDMQTNNKRHSIYKLKSLVKAMKRANDGEDPQKMKKHHGLTLGQFKEHCGKFEHFQHALQNGHSYQEAVESLQIQALERIRSRH